MLCCRITPPFPLSRRPGPVDVTLVGDLADVKGGACGGAGAGSGRGTLAFADRVSGAAGAGPIRVQLSCGLLLRGDGKGNFSAVPGQTSGLPVYGDGRGCAAA